MTGTSADEAAILKVMERQRLAARTGDIDAFNACFAQEPYAARWHASAIAGIFAIRGAEELAARTVESFSIQDRAPMPADDPGVVENLSVRISGDLAWVIFTRRYPGQFEHRASPEAAHALRIFERLDGTWKIVFFGFLDPGTSRPEATRIRIDKDFNVLWMDEGARRALEGEDDLTVRAGKLRLRDGRAHQAFAAAVRWAADQGRGFMPVRGAVPLVIERGEGLAAKIWWVLADSGAIYLTLGDAHRNAQRLDAAALVYGLSPAQRQVAGHIVDGVALPEIAKTMNVRPTTVRTHLDRMFEKTGVRNQTALVRVLLSAAAPL